MRIQSLVIRGGRGEHPLEPYMAYMKEAGGSKEMWKLLSADSYKPY